MFVVEIVPKITGQIRKKFFNNLKEAKDFAKEYPDKENYWIFIDFNQRGLIPLFFYVIRFNPCEI